jgi:guanylate kinase
MKGSLFILSGPSGSGKDALIDALMDKDSSIVRGRKITTRGPRIGEQKNSSYEFISNYVYCSRLRLNKLSYFYVKNENWYAVDMHFIRGQVDSGKNVVLVYSDYATICDMRAKLQMEGFRVRLWLISATEEDMEGRIINRECFEKCDIRIRVEEMKIEIRELDRIKGMYDLHFINPNHISGRLPDSIVEKALADIASLPD